MPELPEVETVRRGLALFLEGRVLTSVKCRRKNLRIPFPVGFEERLTGRTIQYLRRRAKYLLAYLDDGAVLIIHLGMSGRMTVVPPGQLTSQFDLHDHVIFKTDVGAEIKFNDARRFGLMTLTTEGELLKP